MDRVIKLALDDLGCILIPAELRGRLGLAPGMTLVVEKGEDDGVRLRPPLSKALRTPRPRLPVAKVGAPAPATALRPPQDRFPPTWL